MENKQSNNCISQNENLKDKIFDDIENIQDKIDDENFLGSGEYDLHLRTEIAYYIINNFKPIEK